MDKTGNIQKGKLLVAEPFMLDPHFRKSVVLLCEHSDDGGTVGFVINKPLNLGIQDLIPDFPEIHTQIYFGGPVEQDSTLHYLHNVGDLLEGSLQVAPNIWWGGDFDKLKFLIESGLIGADNVRFFLGYSGWEAGQLFEEMEMRSWIVADADTNYIFQRVIKSDLWEKVLKNKGETYSIIAEVPSRFHMN